MSPSHFSAANKVGGSHKWGPSTERALVDFSPPENKTFRNTNSAGGGKKGSRLRKRTMAFSNPTSPILYKEKKISATDFEPVYVIFKLKIPLIFSSF
jgi:hypothetical protein